MKYLYTILMALTLLGCKEQEIIFEGPYHVRFTESSDSEKESFTGTIKLSVHLVAPHRDELIKINYSVSGDAIEGKDYNILGTRGEVTIPRNSSFGYIQIELINNSNNILESQDIIFTLESVSSDDLEVGFGDGVRIGKEMTFTIIDDCILGGTYAGKREGNAQVFSDLSITSQDCITYRISNWDLNVFEFTTERDLTFRDNGDNTLTIPEQEESTLAPEQATIRGEGIVNPATGEITLVVELVDFEGSPKVTLKYNRQ